MTTDYRYCGISQTRLDPAFQVGANKNSKGSLYCDLRASFDTGDGVMIAPHIGYQRVASIANAS